MEREANLEIRMERIVEDGRLSKGTMEGNNKGRGIGSQARGDKKMLQRKKKLYEAGAQEKPN